MKKLEDILEIGIGQLNAKNGTRDNILCYTLHFFTFDTLTNKCTQLNTTKCNKTQIRLN
jgi:hypothetical protein